MCHNMQHHRLLVLKSHKLRLRIGRAYCSPASKRPEANTAMEVATNALYRLSDTGKVFGRNSIQRISAATRSWWNKYEEFVGLNEVREAQGNVTEAEKRFMVARGIVREARETWEAQQQKLKEIRDRLDRVSRDDSQYLELATLEHKLLQEEKRYRNSYQTAEESERETFSLFSAAVRESHEKERTRAEKTKNWSIIGSVLGAIIGVLGSTYINRVRLQELKALVFEAQKGPISLQEAIREQASTYNSQQRDLSDLIANLKNILQVVTVTSQEVEGASSAKSSMSASLKIDPLLVSIKEQLSYSKQISSFFGSLQEQLSNLEKNVRQMATEVQDVKSIPHPTPGGRVLLSPSAEGNSQVFEAENVVLELCNTERRLEAQMKRNSVYSTAFTCAVFAITLPMLYILLKGN
ncbi:mitochondrial potassium channel isoform X2 [Rhineura floridana]|nr:mitochondrial potassium channel isoform X2 [Rhineura floridana]XP_061474921.1 mitochondrial potassium channel isoform X2 [Rhineura floridana]XP_061474922.1 mitochondrial potassium channel isoform X2 [Rhineura floridana]XP_061474923.1 mitochondrial potassium channel isoform X2 [Rhineura floridana]XP_061474924.1 mitochondrial potassium channel isoform X2 [Rhineura floridana]